MANEVGSSTGRGYVSQQELHRKVDTFTPMDNYEKIRRLFDFERGGLKILIVGSGFGELDERLRSLGNTVVGMDINVSEKNHSAGERGGFIECDITAPWPEQLRGAGFDLAVMTDVPEHVYDPKFLIDEAARVLAPNGKIIFGVPNAFDIRQRIALLRGKGIVHWDNLRYGEPAWRYAHVRFFTFGDVLDIVNASGWRAERVQLNFMSGGIVPRRMLPPFVRRALLKFWPGLFSGKFIVLMSRDEERGAGSLIGSKPDLILIDHTPPGV